MPKRPSHATVVAYIALFVALSGTALAASKIKSKDIAKNAVTTKKIKKKAVTEDRLASGAVTNPKLGAGAVGAGKIANDAVGADELAADSVASGKIQKDAVTQGKIADNSVTGGKVEDFSLSPAKIAQTVDSVSFNPGSVTGATCVTSQAVAVPGIQNGDDILVYPENASAGWPANFTLAAYGPGSPGNLNVEVCNLGPTASPGPLPLHVLLFR